MGYLNSKLIIDSKILIGGKKDDLSGTERFDWPRKRANTNY
jgi:hypothetical protein